VHKCVSIVDPLESADTVGNVTIKLREVFSKELFLFIADQVHDVIVVPYDQHDVLLKKAKLITSIMQLSKIYVQVDETMLGNLCPVLDFDDDFTQFSVEVAFQYARSTGLRK